MVNSARRILFVLGLVALGLSTAWPAAATQPIPVPTAADCAALLTAQLSFKDQGSLDYRYAGGVAAHSKRVEPVLTKATLVPATATVPESCRVEGSIPTGNAAEGTNAVRFGVNLPTGWNGRFVMIGDGGFDGAVSASTVRARRRATPRPTATWATAAASFPGATFGFNNRARELDYGFRATHVTTVAAKGLIDVYYSAARAFPTGTAARRAAVRPRWRRSASRTTSTGSSPGDLFNNAVEVAMEQIWSSATFFADRNNDGVGFDNNVTQADLDALRDAVLAKCDVLGNDKIKDNVVGNHRLCARVFTAADVNAFGTARGLTAGQIQALKDVYSGPHDSTGRRTGRRASRTAASSAGARSWCPRRRTTIPGPGWFLLRARQLLFFETDRACRRRGATIPRCCPAPASTGGWTSTSTPTRRAAGASSRSRRGRGRRTTAAASCARSSTAPRPTSRRSSVHRNAKYLLYHGAADGLIATDNTVDYYEGIVKDTFHGHTGQAGRKRPPVRCPAWGTARAACAARRWAGTSCRRWSSGSSTVTRPSRSS